MNHASPSGPFAPGRIPHRPMTRRGSSHVSAIALTTAALALVISVLAFLDVGSSTAPPADEHTGQSEAQAQNHAKSPSASPATGTPGGAKQTSDQPQPTNAGPSKQSPNPRGGNGASKPAARPAHAKGRAIPQPGEAIETPQAPRKLASSKDGPIPDQPPTAANGNVIPWDQAKQYIGSRGTVRGKIVDTHMIESGAICFLNFSKQWQDKFYLAMFNEAFSNPDQPPQEFYLGKTVEVTGLIKTHEGRPQIEIHEPDQIHVVTP